MIDHDALQDAYEDSLFSLIMHDFALRRGEQFLQENSRLAQDPTAELPKALEKRCLRLIDREHRKHSRRTAAVGTTKALGRAALAALIAALLFTAAFALSPNLRIGSLNLLLRIDDHIATWTFRDDAPPVSIPGVEIPPEEEAPDIQTRWLPEGYRAISSEHEILETTNIFGNDEGDYIEIIVILANNTAVWNIDTENADRVENITVNGYSGMLVEKNDSLRIYWTDMDQMLFLEIISSLDNLDVLLRVAENIVLF